MTHIPVFSWTPLCFLLIILEDSVVKLLCPFTREVCVWLTCIPQTHAHLPHKRPKESTRLLLLFSPSRTPSAAFFLVCFLWQLFASHASPPLFHYFCSLQSSVRVAHWAWSGADCELFALSVYCICSEESGVQRFLISIVEADNRQEYECGVSRSHIKSI